jgi:hypothetical protein
MVYGLWNGSLIDVMFVRDLRLVKQHIKKNKFQNFHTMPIVDYS